jgi:hypothetical protein
VDPARPFSQGDLLSGSTLGLLALALLVFSGFVWLRSIRDVRTGERRLLVLGAVAAGLGLGLLALARGPGVLGGVAAGIAVALAAVFFVLQLLGRQARSTPHVAVGRPIPDFTAPDAEGQPFRLSSLHGRPYLLKFFRGHW